VRLGIGGCTRLGVRLYWTPEIDRVGEAARQWTLILAGPWVTYLTLAGLAVCSVVTLAVVLGWSIGLRRRKLLQEELVADLCPLLEKGAVVEAIARCREKGGFTGALVGGALEEYGAGVDIREALEDAAARELRPLEPPLRLLSGAVKFSLLIGLLGASLGMVGALARSSPASANPAPYALAARSLASFAAAVTIALAAALAHNLFRSKAIRLIDRYEELLHHLIHSVRHAEQAGRVGKRAVPAIPVDEA